MEVKEKRRVRCYKVTDSVYAKALSRGRKNKYPLANLLEDVVSCYASGGSIKLFDRKNREIVDNLK